MTFCTLTHPHFVLNHSGFNELGMGSGDGKDVHI